MPGTDLRAGTGTKPERVLTVDNDENLGNGIGEAIYLRKGKLVREQYDVSSMTPVDLGDFTIAGNEVYYIHCLSANTAADKFMYEKFVWMEHINYSKKVVSQAGNGNRVFSIDANGILTETGGGNRDFAVRIERVF